MRGSATTERIRGLRTQIHPALERVLGPRLAQHSAASYISGKARGSNGLPAFLLPEPGLTDGAARARARRLTKWFDWL